MRNLLVSLGIGILIAAAVIFASFTFSTTTAGIAQQKIGTEQPDKCAAPAGYTDEQWKEHMSHHPEQYAECL